MSDRLLYTVRLGLMPYGEALELQRAVARARIAGELAQDVLLLVEHPPVVTLGRTAKQRNLVSPPALLHAHGVELFEVERGGDVTFHGPGQLVGYPIMDLRRHRQDLHWYLRQVEEGLIRAVEPWGIAGRRETGYTGVWVDSAATVGAGMRENDGAGSEREGDDVVRGGPPRPCAMSDAAPRRDDHAIRTAGGDDVVGGGPPAPPRAPRKLASIGVHARGWVTWHGFALNVTTDLSYFDLIVPCGIQGVRMTSMARACGTVVAMREVEDSVAHSFGELFALESVSISREALAAALAAPVA
jgi:lipoyl(octanoyl) transferase